MFTCGFILGIKFKFFFLKVPIRGPAWFSGYPPLVLWVSSSGSLLSSISTLVFSSGSPVSVTGSPVSVTGSPVSRHWFSGIQLWLLTELGFGWWPCCSVGKPQSGSVGASSGPICKQSGSSRAHNGSVGHTHYSGSVGEILVQVRHTLVHLGILRFSRGTSGSSQAHTGSAG